MYCEISISKSCDMFLNEWKTDHILDKLFHVNFFQLPVGDHFLSIWFRPVYATDDSSMIRYQLRYLNGIWNHEFSILRRDDVIQDMTRCMCGFQYMLNNIESEDTN